MDSEHVDTSWPPRALSAFALLVFVVLVGQTLVGAMSLGTSNSEPNHQSRMNTWFDSGWYLPDRFMEGGSPDPDIETGRLHAYGAGYSAFGHAIAVVAGAEEWGATERTAEAFAARRVAVALLGIAGALAVGLASRVSSGSRLVGVWAAAAVMAMPLWTGYAMFAVKDVPSGAGWTFVTAGLVMALYPSDGWRRPAAVAVLCAVGMWFSVGVRTALWVPLVVAVLVFVALAAARGFAVLRSNLIAALAGGSLGMLATAAMHHRNVATPLQWLLSAVRTSGDFHWTGATLSAGQLVSEKPPWWYLPGWLLGSLPVLLGLLAIGGATAAVVAVAQRGGWRERLSRDAAPMWLWGIQAVMLPVVAVLGSATMYAGLRQHLYTLPAIAALAAYAAHLLLQSDRRWPPLLLAVALLLPTVEQSQLYPYQFVYKNVAAGPVDDRWETDMHFVTAREAIQRVPAGVDALCYQRSITLLSGELRQPRLAGCSHVGQIRPYTEEQGSLAGPDPRDGRIWVVGRKYRGSPMPIGCDDADSVTRPLRTGSVTLSYVMLCDPEAFDEAGDGS